MSLPRVINALCLLSLLLLLSCGLCKSHGMPRGGGREHRSPPELEVTNIDAVHKLCFGATVNDIASWLRKGKKTKGCFSES